MLTTQACDATTRAKGTLRESMTCGLKTIHECIDLMRTVQHSLGIEEPSTVPCEDKPEPFSVLQVSHETDRKLAELHKLIFATVQAL